MATIKRGALSAKEKKTIEDLCELKSDADIGRVLKRAPIQIQRYRQEYLSGAPKSTVKRNIAEEYKRELHARPEWADIKEEFSPAELIFFENDYVQLKTQFKDIVHTEFKQVKHLITAEILIHRQLVESKRSISELDRLQKLLDKENAKDVPNDDLIITLMGNIQANKAATSQRTKDYKELEKQHQDLLKYMKSTREQRMQNIDQRGKFLDVLIMLTDEDVRNSINEEVGLYNEAVKAKQKELSRAHKYRDGMIDQPILTAETVKDGQA